MTPKKIVGLMIRTTNENAQAQTEIPELWHRFMIENIGAQITHRLSNSIYVAYYDYEKDHTKPYSCLIGFEVAPDAPIPPGLASHTIPAGNYQTFETTGPLPQAVIELWGRIWQTPLNRSYQTDFEVYNPTSPSVPIYIGIKNLN